MCGASPSCLLAPYLEIPEYGKRHLPPHQLRHEAEKRADSSDSRKWFFAKEIIG
jgi:hypothetical protein